MEEGKGVIYPGKPVGWGMEGRKKACIPKEAAERGYGGEENGTQQKRNHYIVVPFSNFYSSFPCMAS